MDPHEELASNGISEKKRGKQRVIDQPNSKWPSPEVGANNAMDVDDAVETQSTTSSNPLDPDPLGILGDLQLPQNNPAGQQYPPYPKDIPSIVQTTHGEQEQSHKSWNPMQPGREEIDSTQAQSLARQALAGAGDGVSEETSTSYCTDATLSDDFFGMQTEELPKEVWEALEALRANPYFGLPAGITEDGFPYSWLSNVENPFVCQVLLCKKADRTFPTMSALRKHQKNHQMKEVMQFKCPRCMKPFVLRHYLVRHLKSHSNDRPFVCEDCPYRFKRKDQLQKHRKSKSGCERARKKQSTLSGSDAPPTPSNASEAGRQVPSKAEPGDSTVRINEIASMTEDLDIASNSSYPIPGFQPPAPYYFGGS